jgi:hypothetical protein
LAAALPPLAWAAQECAGWFVAERACPAAAHSLSLSAARVAIGAISLAALAVSLIGLARARRLWRALTTGVGEGAVVTPAGERVRFVVTLALVTSATLTLGMALAGLPALFIHHCGVIR